MTGYTIEGDLKPYCVGGGAFMLPKDLPGNVVNARIGGDCKPDHENPIDRHRQCLAAGGWCHETERKYYENCWPEGNLGREGKYWCKGTSRYGKDLQATAK